MAPKRRAAQAERPVAKRTTTETEETSSPPPPAKKVKGRTVVRQDIQTLQIRDDDSADAPVPPSSGLGQETQRVNEAVARFQRQQNASKASFVDRFSKHVEREQAELAASSTRHAEAVKKQADFTTAMNAQIKAALALPPREDVKEQIKKNKTSKAKEQDNTNVPIIDLLPHHSLYAACNAWLNLSTQAISIYHDACTIVEKAKPETTLGANWQHEADALVDMLNLGRRVTERSVDGMMRRRVEGMTDTERLREDEENRKANAVMGMHVGSDTVGKEEHMVPWVESVRCAEKGMKRLASGLPVGGGRV